MASAAAEVPHGSLSSLRHALQYPGIYPASSTPSPTLCVAVPANEGADGDSWTTNVSFQVMPDCKSRFYHRVSNPGDSHRPGSLGTL